MHIDLIRFQSPSPLHEFVVKVAIFVQASGIKTELPTEVTETFLQYAELLAEQGELVTAAKYSKGTSEEGKILRDRLYRSRASRNCFAVLGNAPEFPYTMVAVSKSRARPAVRQQQQQTQNITTGTRLGVIIGPTPGCFYRCQHAEGSSTTCRSTLA